MAVLIPAPEPDGVSPSSPGPYTTSVDATAWVHEVHGQLVRAWLSPPVRTVVAEGPSTPSELEQLMRFVPSGSDVVTVVLLTPYDVALRRALKNTDRGLSKDPDFLRADHSRFQDGLPDLTCDLALDGAEATATRLAERVIVTLDSRQPSPFRK